MIKLLNTNYFVYIHILNVVIFEPGKKKCNSVYAKSRQVMEQIFALFLDRFRHFHDLETDLFHQQE